MLENPKTHKTAYATHRLYPEHDTPGHPEHAGRIRAVWERLKKDGLTARLHAVPVNEVTREQMIAVHTPEYIDLLESTRQLTQTARLDADTYITPHSYEVARLSAGAVVSAVESVLTGEARTGIAAVRPPGHHAEKEVGMGFCLLNNVAIAARNAQRRHGLTRILIVDFDVHHGNGTENIFYDDPSVLFISSHQYGNRFYPGTGEIDAIGAGRGEGYNLNIPLPAGTGDSAFVSIYREIVWKAAERFRPEFILVSAGFDAHWQDPLARLRLTLNGYAHLCRELLQMAETLCDGRIVFAMEGGYKLDTLSIGMSNIALMLLGDETVDLIGAPPSINESPIEPLIAQLKTLHHL